MSEQDQGSGKKSRASILARLAGRERRLCSSTEALQSLFTALGGEETGGLTALWKNWPSVMGDEIASLGMPLGHTDRILQIGADDSMALQELSLQAEEICERANAFLGSEWFTGVKVLLVQGRRNLAAPRTVEPAHAPPVVEDAPRLGKLLGKLDPDSPVTRCYEAYVALSRKRPSKK